MSSGSPVIDSFQEKGWALVQRGQHPLADLHNRNLSKYTLVVMVNGKSMIGASYFKIYLRNAAGKVSHQPVIFGLHNRGEYPAYNWIEIIRIATEVRFGADTQVVEKLSDDDLQHLFNHLAELIPPGGHIMVEYDSPEQQETAKMLALGVPPVTTPLGYKLFVAGCGVSFKDWYFAEGGSEGPRKLQGYKALDEQHARLRAADMARQLNAFISRTQQKQISELEKVAIDRALAVLNKLKQVNRNQHN